MGLRASGEPRRGLGRGQNNGRQSGRRRRQLNKRQLAQLASFQPSVMFRLFRGPSQERNRSRAFTWPRNNNAPPKSSSVVAAEALTAARPRAGFGAASARPMIELVFARCGERKPAFEWAGRADQPSRALPPLSSFLFPLSPFRAPAFALGGGQTRNLNNRRSGLAACAAARA